MMRHKNPVPFCCRLLLLLSIFVSCKRPASTIVMHAALGDMVIRTLPGLSAEAAAPLDALLASNPDSLAIDKVLHDGFIQLNFQANTAQVRPGEQDVPLSGALVISGGRFYLVQGRAHTDASLDKWEQTTGRKIAPKAREHYKQQGGTLALEGRCSVVGKLVSGKEVLDRIAALPNDANGRPLRAVPLKLEERR
jgi:hypothetical protein